MSTSETVPVVAALAFIQPEDHYGNVCGEHFAQGFGIYTASSTGWARHGSAHNMADAQRVARQLNHAAAARAAHRRDRL